MRIQKCFLRNVFSGFAVLSLVACSSVNQDAALDDKVYEVDNVEQTNSAVYRCDNTPVNIYFHAEQAQLSWHDKTYVLTHAVSASGVFYLGEELSFWIHGDDAELEFNGMEKSHCHLLRVES
ncbi:MliC family protein [Marinomonas profundimaris]|uniref:C-type lysozyme inhibitor domain-containing protein n=1 Tax=Marinomonas profundimaris TaxID=1208321 RepID=W1S2G6_9GAMM|nr:MliC family protein [Marinomonas profundimaris]ETI62209.1 hypothetical protein D104_00175 [Marinomonas profundimaris]